MYYKVVKLRSFNICGFSTELTRSMKENYQISSNFWKTFNRRIKSGQLTQGKFWTKYALTYSKDNKYRYFIGIPLIEPTPLDFTILQVPESYCLVFNHVGSVKTINNTINKIYREFLPNNLFKPKKDPYFHFEKYDYRFNNSPTSIIEIYLPIDILKEVVYEED